jgi:hypothetical protein
MPDILRTTPCRFQSYSVQQLVVYFVTLGLGQRLKVLMVMQ